MLERITNSIRGSSERSRSKEIPVEEKYRASGLILRIRESNSSISSLIPDMVSQISHLPGLEDLYLTESCWLLKDDPSPAAGQLQLPGGRRRDEKDGKKEDPVRTLIRETGEEIHVFGIVNDRVNCITEWEHSFEHDRYPEEGTLLRPVKKKRTRIKYHNTVLIAEAPATTDPQSYKTGDSIKEVVRLNLKQLRYLLDHNHIYLNGKHNRKVDLQDSLSSDTAIRGMQKTQTDGQEEAIKPKLIQAALAFEVKTLVRVAQKFFDISLSQDKWANYVRKKFTYALSGIDMDDPREFYRMEVTKLDSLRSVLVSLLNATEKNLSAADVDLSDTRDVLPLTYPASSNISGPDRNRLRKRVKLIRNLRRAQKLVTIENNLISFAHAGPQAPFLFGQSFLLLNKYTPHEYKLMARNKEMRDLLGTLCEVFNVETDKYPDWYEELKRRMALYREQKTHYNLNPASIDEETKLQVESKSQQLASKFAAKLKIPPSELADHLEKALRYSQRYIPQALASSPHLPKHLQAQLVPVRLGKGSVNFDELCLSMMGIPSSKAETVTPESRWVALRTILLAITDLEAKRMAQRNNIQSVLDPFLTYFNLLKLQTVGTERGKEADNKTYERAVLDFRSELEYTWGESVIVFRNIQPQILSYFREKDEDSIVRKLIERGRENGNSILDYNGRMFTIDTEYFWNELIKIHPFAKGASPKDKAEITRIWVGDVVKYILNHYEEYAKRSGYKAQRFNPRIYGIFENLFEHDYFAGSGASKITWDWFKCVLEFSHDNLTFREELQFFTSEGAADKLSDDKRYSYERQFIAHEPGYYPPVTVYFLPHREYGKLVEQGLLFQSGSPPRGAVIL